MGLGVPNTAQGVKNGSLFFTHKSLIHETKPEQRFGQLHSNTLF